MSLFKLSCVTLVLLLLVTACGTTTLYQKTVPAKIMVPPYPRMEEDQFQYRVLKSGQECKVQSGGAVLFDRVGFEGLKVHLKSVKLWMETIYKLAENHNNYVDEILKENASARKKGWFW